jgi:hypothetical protein
MDGSSGQSDMDPNPIPFAESAGENIIGTDPITGEPIPGIPPLPPILPIPESSGKIWNYAIEGAIAGDPADDAYGRISPAAARQQSTYEEPYLGWDFYIIWKMVSGYSFPQLQWQTEYTDGSSTGKNTDGNSGNSDSNGSNNSSNSGNGGGGGGGGTPSTQQPAEKPAETTAQPAPAAPESNTGAGSTAAVSQFADAQNHWAHDAIDFVISGGLFKGVSADSFAPDATMTRAMFVTVLARYTGGESNGTVSFGDIPDGKWYTNGVLWAAENGIVSGVGDGNFDPDGSVTREQLAVMLHNCAKFEGLDVSGDADMSAFADENGISAWARDALDWAVSGGLISGKPGGLLDPKGTATRAEVATILQRYIALIRN